MWSVIFIKDTIIWATGTAFVLLINIEKVNKETSYFKKLFIDNFKFVLFFEFIINLFTFSFIVELILFPLILIIVVLNAISGTKKEFESVKRLTDYILALLGLIIFSYILIKTINDLGNITSIDNLKSFLLPILLTITYIPFLYIFALFITYEELFMRIKFFIKDNKELNKFVQKRILYLCNLNLYKLNIFSKLLTSYIPMLDSKESILIMIEDFKKVKKKGQPLEFKL
ncbi:MAG: hypothetical protein PHE84_00290 [bacterium]|nr:hypothetical protein [bacterium]